MMSNGTKFSPVLPIRRDEPKAAMAMLAVVPLHEWRQHQAAGFLHALEGGWSINGTQAAHDCRKAFS